MDPLLTQQSRPNNLVPVAIIIAGALVAGAIYLGGKSPQVASTTAGQTTQGNGRLDKLAPVTSQDHIRGDLNAPVKIVEYSDFECPACKSLHPTMKQVMSEYGASGQVAWVYRHFPIDDIHPVKARKEAVAAECANELGGNDGFWGFADRFFELTPSNNDTDIDIVIPQIIKELGLNEEKFAACLASSKYDQHIEDEVQNALAIGSTGTPTSVIVAPNGKKYLIVGAQPYSALKLLINVAVQAK